MTGIPKSRIRITITISKQGYRRAQQEAKTLGLAPATWIGRYVDQLVLTGQDARISSARRNVAEKEEERS